MYRLRMEADLKNFWTKHIQSMIDDSIQSKKLSNDFNNAIGNEYGFELNVTVCNHGAVMIQLH